MSPVESQISLQSVVKGPLRPFFAASVAVLVAFGWLLFRLFEFSLGSSLYSHILLVPVISVYLIWQWGKSPTAAFHHGSEPQPNRGLALGFFVAGALFGAIWATAGKPTEPLPIDDWLAYGTLTFLGCLGGVVSWYVDRRVLRALLFPLGFLIFMTPLPVFVQDQVEYYLQHGSAAVAQGFFSLAGTTVFADGLVFQLTTITLKVAPECSGIHSSLALFITSLLAGHFFLRSRLNRGILALAVIPLAFLRNGFRVFTLGELCVRIGPHMIDSYIHHHGGPIFFALSLVPFFFLLYLLRRSERPAGALAA